MGLRNVRARGFSLLYAPFLCVDYILSISANRTEERERERGGEREERERRGRERRDAAVPLCLFAGTRWTCGTCRSWYAYSYFTQCTKLVDMLGSFILSLYTLTQQRTDDLRDGEGATGKIVRARAFGDLGRPRRAF